MRWRIILALLPLALSAPGSEVRPDRLPLDHLERRLEQIDSQLSRLADYSLSGGIGPIGFRSHPNDVPNHPEWIEVRFGRIVALDEIVLVPTIRRDTTNGFQADAFPQALRVFGGTGQERDGRLIAEFCGDSGLLPRIAPLVIPCRGMQAEWVRVEATTLSLRAFDRKYVFQLAEVLAFSGQENVALRKLVRSSSGNNPALAPGWAESYVVDGVLPYLMAAASGTGSVAYVNQFDLGDSPAFSIDLETVQRLNRVHLHAIDQSNTVPQAFAGEFGIPKLLRIEGSCESDFSDARALVEIHCATLYDAGPILMWEFPPVDCRYVRIRAMEHNASALYGPIGERFGFAEIELFSGDRNAALYKPVTATFNPDSGTRRLSHLTDGMNYYGTILPVREWLSQLAERNDLERERPIVTGEIDRRHATHRKQLTAVVWLAAVLGLSVIGIALASRIQRQRAIEQTRNRIAADLHDELGADLHAVGLVTDLARSAAPNDEKLLGLLQRARSLTERAAKAARHCTNLLEAPGLFGDLADDMRRAAERLLADLEHQLEIEQSDLWRTLPLRARTDLLLFYQECLTNIIRHSGATRAETHLHIIDGKIHLSVRDNGQGLRGEIPTSLERRARLLGAELSAQRLSPNGLQVDLYLKLRRFALFG
ncbi:MAG: sensor histidine kinase [Opitutaceae bacterium]